MTQMRLSRVKTPNVNIYCINIFFAVSSRLGICRNLSSFGWNFHLKNLACDTGCVFFFDKFHVCNPNLSKIHIFAIPKLNIVVTFEQMQCNDAIVLDELVGGNIVFQNHSSNWPDMGVSQRFWGKTNSVLLQPYRKGEYHVLVWVISLLL